MTAIVASARRRGDAFQLPPATETAPYGSITLCDLPAYVNGNLATIHPSVHDFGMRWNGYRWWMANTPYPPAVDENPIIYGSNDMVTWVTPAGLTNPIDPTPEGTWYNSDTELCVDDEGNLVCIYRDYNYAESWDRILARVSPDGTQWGDEVVLFEPKSLWGGLGMSPAVVRYGPGDFRMWAIGMGTVYLRAPNPLGPWRVVSDPSVSPSYHGDVIKYGDALLMANSDSVDIFCGHSMDGGLTWSMSSAAVVSGGVATAYRPTISASPKAGWIDIWHGGSVPDVGFRTAYTRVPVSEFGLPQ